MRDGVARGVLHDTPRLSVGRPMCGPFGTMSNINYAQMIGEEKRRKIEHGQGHLEIGANLHDVQWIGGQYVIHEHPDAASSWQEECIVHLLKRRRVVRVVRDQCRYGLKSHDGRIEGPARKRTGFMTTPPPPRVPQRI